MNGYISINSMGEESYGTFLLTIIVDKHSGQYEGYTISKFKTREEFEKKVPFKIKHRTPSYRAGRNSALIEFYDNKFMFMYASYFQKLEVKIV